MPKGFVHVNGVDYELADDFENYHVEQHAKQLGRGQGEQLLEVVLDGRRTTVKFALDRVWASGSALVEPLRSAYEDSDLTIV